MLTHPTIDKLETLRLTGMARALKEQWEMRDINELVFEERLSACWSIVNLPCGKAETHADKAQKSKTPPESLS